MLEPFGSSVYIIRAVPKIMADEDAAKAFIGMLDEMTQGGDIESWSDRAAYSLACHAAIRAGKALTHEEMTALTRQLEQCDQPHTCPHGRPTMIHIGVSRLEREFGRRGQSLVTVATRNVGIIAESVDQGDSAHAMAVAVPWIGVEACSELFRTSEKA